jgi:hypothetical protein
MIWENDGIGPRDIGGELSIGDISVYALDQVRVRTASDGLNRSSPAFPGLTDYRQTKSFGLITVERAECSNKVLDAFKRANYADVQEPERVVGVRVDWGDR